MKDEKLSQQFKSAIEWVGELWLFIVESFKNLPKLWERSGLFLNQCEFVGVSSVGILTVAAIFMGAVMGYQLYTSFALFGAQALVGGSLGVSIFRELAPTIGAVMVTGRAGAAIGAEVSSMKVSEQIDALEVMGVNPYEYLVVPRIAAGAISMPILAFYFGLVATLSGVLVACGVMGLSYSTFWTQFKAWVDWIDLLHCFVKSISFGFALTLLGCFFGFRAVGGAKAVGLATRSTVVTACLSILMLDYFWTMILPIRAAEMVQK